MKSLAPPSPNHRVLLMEELYQRYGRSDRADAMPVSIARNMPG